MLSWYTAAQMQAHSLYLHIPFCHHRCSYCDFNTYSGMESLIPDYVGALCQEMNFVSRSHPDRIPVHTIFFGGGTPSLLPGRELSRIFDTLQQAFILLEECEITLEANPDRLSYEYLKSLHEQGVNRISLGMQSANPEDLLLLERQHDFKQVAKAFGLVRQAGFDNVNLDLIFGIPNQSLDSWQRTLDLGISLNPDHFSLYALTIEDGTPMGGWVTKGLLSEPNPDLAAEMYELAGKKLAVHGYEQYEISNWARWDKAGKLQACLHNLQYWRNLPYLGFGAGAHGYAGGMRTANELNPNKYVGIFSTPYEISSQNNFLFPSTPVTVNSIAINREEEMKETMLMGLRLTAEGVSKHAFKVRFGGGLEETFKREIEPLLNSGLLKWDSQSGDLLKLTPRGRLLGNQVFMQFV